MEARPRRRALTPQILGLTPARAHRSAETLDTCDEGKGQEFDMIVIPDRNQVSFEDNQQARQLLYVSLSRARHRLFLRVPTTDAPALAYCLGQA